MTTTTTTSKRATRPFELKGSLFTLTVLHLHSSELTVIDRYLAEKINQAPGFFHNTPVVVDLQALADDVAIDFIGLVDLLRNRGMIPVAIRHGWHKSQ